MVKMAIYTQKCEQKWLKINNKGGGIKMSWVGKNWKINNSGLESSNYASVFGTVLSLYTTIIMEVQWAPRIFSENNQENFLKASI